MTTTEGSEGRVVEALSAGAKGEPLWFSLIIHT
jgi:hypothetical protein